MSTGRKTPYEKALPVAMKVLYGLSVACTRIEIAGSLRRQKDMIGDLEIVAIPDGDRLYELLDKKLADGRITHLPKKRWGLKQRAFMFDGFQFDVYIQPDPATWGYNFLARTGSAEFSHLMVTKRSEGGWKPDCFECKNARVWWSDKVLDTPDEQNIFALWGMDYVAPEMRTAEYTPGKLRQALDFTLDDVPELAEVPEKLIDVPVTKGRFTEADAARIVAQYANEPLPVFPHGAAAAARAAIEESERIRAQGVRG